ncbi:putative zinc-binding [Hyphodiscus hymeniophilus]|uniref:Zinc-binding n=1 Tax=Hyphodiscus hymeniophilus TaxID=353542 RepID=A0A9P6VG37_9HELO|nr:putative zinc-binding [Hyphodiscus hymeniophilus]
MRGLFQPDKHATRVILKDHPVPKPNFELNEHLIRVYTVAPCAGELLWSANYPVPDPQSKVLIPCFDVEGTVMAAPQSSPFKVGEEVYGQTNYYRTGCASEYTIGRTEELALKPKSLSWAEAVTVPLSSLTVWQALFTHAGLGGFSPDRYRGKRMLVTAASGGVGIWAVQIAKLAGFEVVRTCGPRNVDFVRSLGAAEVLDYTTTNMREWAETDVKKVDLVLDCVGKRTLEDTWWAVKEGGVLISISQPPEQVRPADWSGKAVRNLFFIMVLDGAALMQISNMIEKVKCRPVLDSVWPLEKFEDAFKKLASGHARGKVVIDMLARV